MKKANKKGMTLVEVVISMAVLGVIAAMFVSIAIAAKKQNTDNYQRQREMYQQAAAAESYNPDVEYGMNVKVRRLNSDNKVEMSADFSKVGGYNIETDAYGYYAIRQGKDQKDTNYNLRFFRSKDAEIGPKPDEGEYWFKIYNQSGSDLELYVSTPEEDGGRFFDDEKNSCGGEFGILLKDNGSTQFGLVAGTGSNVFGISLNEGLFKASHVPSSWDHAYNVSEFLGLQDVEDGNPTGYITLYFCDDGVIRNRAEYESYTSGGE